MTNPTQPAPAAAAPVRVVIVDDHALVRSGVRAQLDGHITVVGEANDVAPGVAAVVATQPTSYFSTSTCPPAPAPMSSPLSATAPPGTRWLALSISDAPEDVVTVIRAGANGYLTKSVSAEGLVDAVHRVAEGDAVFSPRLAGFVLDSFRADTPPPPPPIPSWTCSPPARSRS